MLELHVGRQGLGCLSCGAVVGHWSQLHILDLDVTALERRPIHPGGGSVRRGDGYELGSLQHLPILSHVVYLQIALAVLRDLHLLPLRHLGDVEVAYLDLAVLSDLVDLDLLGVGQGVVQGLRRGLRHLAGGGWRAHQGF